MCDTVHLWNAAALLSILAKAGSPAVGGNERPQSCALATSHSPRHPDHPLAVAPRLHSIQGRRICVLAVLPRHDIKEATYRTPARISIMPMMRHMKITPFFPEGSLCVTRSPGLMYALASTRCCRCAICNLSPAVISGRRLRVTCAPANTMPGATDGGLGSVHAAKPSAGVLATR
jgi:hypothetical protein